MAVAKRFFLCLGMVAVSMTFRSNAAGDTKIGSPVRDGRISSLFGMREDPFEGEQRFHAGIDIAAPVGIPVRPVAAGRVIFSGSYKGFGRIILKTAVIIGFSPSLSRATADRLGTLLPSVRRGWAFSLGLFLSESARI